MVLLQVVMLLCLAFICYQDLVYRAVYWLCFPVLAAVMFMSKYNLKGLQEAFINATYGISFLMVQLLILWSYFSIKNKKVINLTNDYLGWGDVLFLAAIPFYLSPVNYILFYVISLIAVLLYTIVVASLKGKTNNPHIPLAGLQAGLLVLVMLVDFVSPKFMLYDDSWLYF
ncbi:hypothetical protein EZ444_07295 [Pedobacter hiemivivus]|uniref:Prepilin type IV endopeptidase peptidase domain-containing protein n=2 Tax=Pedobacter hiemivivus TaxID=2530454 RepID=A0A4R0NEJ9_9SPHI|nr:hypothetical protein EZ444_07295 [Pedobacter hiemivivus]